jgi:hypothetical protein
LTPKRSNMSPVPVDPLPNVGHLQRWRSLLGRILAIAIFIVVTCAVPARLCRREATAWFNGDPALQDSLANGVERWVTRAALSRDRFSTGSRRFGGEWLLGTYQMAAIGFAQIALARPDTRARNASRMAHCIERLLAQEVRSFDREAWGEDALDGLPGGRGHAGYLGYINLVLSLHRLLDRTSRFAGLNDRITAALVRRVETSPTLLVETYPGELYPIDNTPLMASVALHSRAVNESQGALLRRWATRVRRDYVDHETGLLFQAVDRLGLPKDHPRGSGTLLSSYFLSFFDQDLSHELYRSARRELASSLLGFGLMREFPRHQKSERGDIDSGPIIMGYSVSATGFSLGAARVNSDEERFVRTYATTHLFGAPHRSVDRLGFVVGGPLGDAFMLAMLTARRPGESR